MPWSRGDVQSETKKRLSCFNEIHLFVREKVKPVEVTLQLLLHSITPLTLLCNRFSKAFKIKRVALKNVFSYHEVMDQVRLLFFFF